MEIKTVGVIGAGVMGIGVSQNLAQTGHQVILLDVSDEILERAKQEIRNNIRFQNFFNKQNQSDSNNILDRINFSTDYSVLSKAEFIVENATEKWNIKKIFTKKSI